MNLPNDLIEGKSLSKPNEKRNITDNIAYFYTCKRLYKKKQNEKYNYSFNVRKSVKNFALRLSFLPFCIFALGDKIHTLLHFFSRINNIAWLLLYNDCTSLIKDFKKSYKCTLSRF